MPARKPVVTGIESRSATKPSRKTPARDEDEADAQRERGGRRGIVRAARRPPGSASAPAKIGAIVESAPTDIPGSRRTARSRPRPRSARESRSPARTPPAAPSPSARGWRSPPASNRRQDRVLCRSSANRRRNAAPARLAPARRPQPGSSRPIARSPRGRSLRGHRAEFRPMRQPDCDMGMNQGESGRKARGPKRCSCGELRSLSASCVDLSQRKRPSSRSNIVSGSPARSTNSRA